MPYSLVNFRSTVIRLFYTEELLEEHRIKLNQKQTPEKQLPKALTTDLPLPRIIRPVIEILTKGRPDRIRRPVVEIPVRRNFV